MNDKSKIGAVTIVGGGIAGIQAALDIANSGFRVTLVEEQPSVGGVMAQLDKTFPTNDCSSCMMGPKLVELANHPNIEILAYSELLDVQGEPGRFKVFVKKKARAVDPDKCVGCGVCASKCPTRVPDSFNGHMSYRKAIYVPFPQAVPLVYTIDKEHCRYFTKGKCRICEKVCSNNAICYDQQDETVSLDAGAVILAGGYEPFDASSKPEYGYGLWPNVVTSLEYERMLSAAGPFHGHVQRLSDGRPPRKIAWIQCVGSRDINVGRPYCSSVCCMYATKQALITKEHDSDAETTIFYIDIRAQGKGFDRYFERARDVYGVRYVRSMVSRVVPVPERDTLEIQYLNHRHELRSEEFDMVVLSVGLIPSPSAVRAAERLGIRINEYGFAATEPLDMVATSRPGIYVTGVFQGPKDIPDSVQQASGAAAAATELLAEARGTLVTPPTLPEERPVAGEPPRVGVFVCHCGINIAGVVRVDEVAEYARSLPGVVYASDTMFACSTDQQQEIKRVIEEKRLNRIVVASCTPRTHEPLFRKTLREAGLNPYLFELANIREHVSWVHQKDPKSATEKAKDLVRMAVSRALLLEPLQEISFSVNQTGLVIGGGLAGLTASLTLAEQGFPVVLVEATEELGGNARTLHFTEDGGNPARLVEELAERVLSHPRITVHKNAEVVSVTGGCGNFVSVIQADGESFEVSHGVVIVATGGEEHKPSEYLYGHHPRVVTQKEFESLLVHEPERIRRFRRIVMIQCVGSREPEHPYCSRVCCTAAVKNSLKFKELQPEGTVCVLYRDIRTYAFKELKYREAREKGVCFFRYDPDAKPQVKAEEDQLFIAFHDAHLQRRISFTADLLVLSTAIRPRASTKELAERLRLPLDQDDFLLEAHPKLRPLDFSTSGIFLCGLAQGPKFSDESIVQARGAALRAAGVLSQKEMVHEGCVTQVDPFLCRGCGECEQTCVFEAIKVVEKEDGRRQAQVNEALCTGCGACNVACPTGAASLAHFRDAQINAVIRAV